MNRFTTTRIGSRLPAILTLVALSAVPALPYTIVDLAPTLGGTASVASFINNAGDVTGTEYLTGNVNYHAFF